MNGRIEVKFVRIIVIGTSSNVCPYSFHFLRHKTHTFPLYNNNNSIFVFHTILKVFEKSNMMRTTYQMD